MSVCLFLTSMSMNEDDGIGQEMFSKKQIGYNTMKVNHQNDMGPL